MAGTTGLEPAASAVTGQRSNQLNYVPTRQINEMRNRQCLCGFEHLHIVHWLRLRAYVTASRAGPFTSRPQLSQAKQADTAKTAELDMAIVTSAARTNILTAFAQKAKGHAPNFAVIYWAAFKQPLKPRVFRTPFLC